MTSAKSLKRFKPVRPEVNLGATCLICGAPFNAMWIGLPGEFHYFCTTCAVEVFPQVIADAVVDQGADPEAAWKTSEHFYRKALIKQGVQVASSELPLKY